MNEEKPQPSRTIESLYCKHIPGESASFATYMLIENAKLMIGARICEDCARLIVATLHTEPIACHTPKTR